MAQELPFKSGDEQDALTGWRRVIAWRPGQRKRIKRVYRRRVRAYVRKALRRGVDHE